MRRTHHETDAALGLCLKPRLSAAAVVALRHRHGSFAAAARAVLTHTEFGHGQQARLQAEALGVQVVTLGNSGYPPLLAQSPTAPPLLYVRGRSLDSVDPAVAIVGARKASPEGLRIARTLAQSLAEIGITVVSGLALGVDGAAHRGALDGGGPTIAVLGSGVDVVYPAQHRELAAGIATAGTVVSQFPLGAPPARHHFPIRNHVIACLARAVIVVEAAERSGSLITAHLAADEGRAVLAVPGSPLSQSHRGTNALIREGATLLQDLSDVLEELPSELRPTVRALPVSGTAQEDSLDELAPAERTLLGLLSNTLPQHPDELAARSGMACETIVPVLLGLELQGHVCPAPGGRYLRQADTAPLRRR